MTERRRSKKWLYLVFMILLLILAGVVVFLVWDSYFKEPSETSDNEMSNNVAQVSEAKKQDVVSKAESEKMETVEKEKVVQYEGGDPNEMEKLTGVMTYAAVNDGVLMVRVNIDQYLASGTCELAILTGGTNIYSATANIIDSAATATCEGFNVPVSETWSGALQIVVYLSADGKTGEIAGEVQL